MPVKSPALSVNGQVSSVTPPPYIILMGPVTVRADSARLRLNKQSFRPTSLGPRAVQWQELLFFGSSLMTGSEQMPCTLVGKELSSDLPIPGTANPLKRSKGLPLSLLHSLSM